MTAADIRTIGTELGLPNVRASRVRGGVWLVSWGQGVERNAIEMPADATPDGVREALAARVQP